MPVMSQFHLLFMVFSLIVGRSHVDGLFRSVPLSQSSRARATGHVRHMSGQLGISLTESSETIPAAVADSASWLKLCPAAEAAVNTELPSHLQWRLQRATWYLRNAGGQHCRAIDRAAQIATAAHMGQKRKSGEDFIIHPVETACILAELKMDVQTIVAGLLHDTVEDTNLSLSEVQKMFGSR